MPPTSISHDTKYQRPYFQIFYLFKTTGEKSVEEQPFYLPRKNITDPRVKVNITAGSYSLSTSQLPNLKGLSRQAEALISANMRFKSGGCGGGGTGEGAKVNFEKAKNITLFSHPAASTYYSRWPYVDRGYRRGSSSGGREWKRDKTAPSGYSTRIARVLTVTVSQKSIAQTSSGQTSRMSKLEMPP